MKAKSIVSTVLLLFVAVSVVYLALGESASRSESPQAGPEEPVVQTGPAHAEGELAKVSEEPGEPEYKIVAYYFHRTQRCRTCLTMEAYAGDALKDGLPDEIGSGALEWRTVNLEEPQHEHFVQDYELTASALVMVLFENGEQKQWKDLDRIWDLVGDEWGFKEYVRNEALDYLENAS